MSQTQTSSRIYWIDSCKAYAMVLVFYGHLWLSDQMPNTEVLMQNKLIYAFHMPLFFILSGFLEKSNTKDFKVFIKNKFFTRIVPFILFNLLLIVCLIPKDILIHKFSLGKYLFMLTGLIRGQGSISVVTWFLICLFTTELIHFWLSRKINNYKGMVIAFIIFYTVGIIVAININLVATLTGIAPNFWYIHEALVAYSFFTLGVILNKIRLFEITNKLVKYLCLILSAVVLLTSFNLNNGLNDPSF
ncbi:MAG: acyltransferase family protein [Nostocaceae cyanobacterium]|nr:acyltransferase family protein [Nostocaceae cyanobacterium]